MRRRDRLHRAYPELRRAEKAIACSQPGYKAKRRREKVRVMADILRAELRGAAA